LVNTKINLEQSLLIPTIHTAWKYFGTSHLRNHGNWNR